MCWVDHDVIESMGGGGYWCSPGGGGARGGGGGGHCLFEGRYPLPNYRPCFLALSAPQFSLSAPCF